MLVTHDSEIFDLSKMAFRPWEFADEIAYYNSALGQNPVIVAQAAARHPVLRPPPSVSTPDIPPFQKDITRRQHHRPPGHRLNRNGRSLRRQFERANITLVTARFGISNLL